MSGDRPLSSKSIGELEAVLQKAVGDPAALRELADELKHRNTQRARELQARVEKALHDAGHPAERVQEAEPARYSRPAAVEVAPAAESPPDADARGVPSCPQCQAPMKLHTAKRGRNKGGRFWGCSRYPQCPGTRAVGDESASTGGATSDESPAMSPAPRLPDALPVAWVESARRAGFIAEYVSVGAIPGVLRERLQDQRIHRGLNQTLLLSRRGRPRQATDHARLVSALLVKLLQRGRTPLPTLDVEGAALRARGFLGVVTDLREEATEVGWQARPGTALRATPDEVLAAITERAPFKLDPAFAFDPSSDTALLQSEAESVFLERWVPERLGAAAGHWFTPQAPLDRLLEGAGAEEGGARRIDFLFCHPGGPPLAIEIDGPEHSSTVDVDLARDEALRALGIEVFRVSNDEVVRGTGAVLDRLRQRCEAAIEALPATAESSAAGLVIDCALAAKVQLAVARAVGYGWLAAEEDWDITVSGMGAEVATAAVLDSLRLLGAFDVLYGGRSIPVRCIVRTDEERATTWLCDTKGQWCETHEGMTRAATVRIAVERNAGPFHAVAMAEVPDFVVRPAFIPLTLAAEHTFDLGRRAIVPPTYHSARPALTDFLRNVFRKYDFRPMQGEAIYNALRQRDCVVLLPTGAGKSLIYQLAGLLMPGVTLVVDPLIALIEDQVEGLQLYGIDRAAPITSSLSTPEERRRLLLRVERGEYQFVLHSPERLQSRQFRGTLRALAESSLVNLAVIDEAHCVSEWGHDFRPAYLNLGNNLRRFGADRGAQPPPLLALTGTASRAVLRDVLADLGIDRNRSDALIRPESFDRSELTFEIVRTSPREDPLAALRGVMHALPARFGLPRTEFYRAAGRDTASGIVFVPTVNARVHGILDAADAVRSATGATITYYAGSPPRGFDSMRWDEQKRANAAEFKRNRTPVLVATKAFGMGIDKPNIRYTVHFGMPSSLESLYQEAGRAGRDRRPARCTVVFSEHEAARSDALLDPELDFASLRERFAEADRDRHTTDDATRALWFHLRAFTGLEQDVEDVKRVLDEIGELSTRQRVELPFWEDDDKRKERAIYRLLKLAVLHDYEVEFGAEKFVADVGVFDFDRSRLQLLNHVHAAQPARAKALARRVDEIPSGSGRDRALGLARVLIEFTYDVIERSRRRMIQEAVLLARHARSDQEIRTRLLDYLQEGFGAERLEQLLRSSDADFGDWWDLVEKIQTPMDAGELRGLCIRALESYPDHPGLLLTRSIAEVMCSDHDDGISAQGIGAAIRAAVQSYEIPQDAVEATIDRMFDLAAARARNLGPPLVMALLDLGETEPRFEFAKLKGLRGAKDLDDARVRAVVSVLRLRTAVTRAEAAVNLVVERYCAPEVARAL